VLALVYLAIVGISVFIWRQNSDCFGNVLFCVCVQG